MYKSYYITANPPYILIKYIIRNLAKLITNILGLSQTHREQIIVTDFFSMILRKLKKVHGTSTVNIQIRYMDLAFGIKEHTIPYTKLSNQRVSTKIYTGNVSS